MSDVSINKSSPDCKVNFLEYIQQIGDKKTTWTWVTDIAIERTNVVQIMQAGRARWRIENETFNTLKNHGYEFEHNFGHGHKNLSLVLATSMLIAFAVDQIMALTCSLFQKARKRLFNAREHWLTMRYFFKTFYFSSAEEFVSALAHGIRTQFEILPDTS